MTGFVRLCPYMSAGCDGISKLDRFGAPVEQQLR